MMSRTIVPVSSSRSISRFVSVAGSTLFAASLVVAGNVFGGETLSIKSLAPEKSILVVGIDDIAATKLRFEKTPVGAWWNSKEVQERSKQWKEKLNSGIDKMTQDLGVARDAVQCPASLGAAFFAELNEETGAYEPGLMLFVDWGKEAENFGKVYDAAIAKMEKEAADAFKVEDIKGHRVYVANAPKPEAAKGGAAGGGKAEGGEAGEGEADPFAGPSGPKMFEKMCFTRDAGRLLVAGSPGSMQELLGSLENDKRKSVSDSEDFRGTMELTGSGKDMYGVLLTEPAQKLVASMGPEVGMVMPFLTGLFGDVRGFGFGVSLDGSSAPIESGIGMYIPGPKVGLLSLLPGAVAEKLPAMIPADAISYSHMNFQFSGLMKVVDEFIASLPEAFQGEIKGGLEPFDPVLRSAFGAMGPSMHIWSTLKQPITAESSRSTFAIAVSDKNVVQKAVQTFAPMTGLEPRDFVGNTIYSADSEVMPFALGLGGSYMFMGQTESVEQSLRALGSNDAASGLAADPTFKAVSAHWTGSDLVGYGYTNTAAALEAQESMFETIAPMLEGATEQAAGDLPVGLDINPSDFLKALDPKLMKAYFGPSTWEVRSVKTGFRFVAKMLPVAGK